MTAQSKDKADNRIKGYMVSHLTGAPYEVNVVYERGLVRVDSHTYAEDFETLKQAVEFITSVETDPNQLP